MKPSRKRRQERRHFSGGRDLVAASARSALDVKEWRDEWRYQALVDFAKRTKGLKWSKKLFLLLLEELYVGDEFDEIIGRPEKLPPSRYPQAVAFAIALRHSWRPEDLEQVAASLRRK